MQQFSEVPKIIDFFGVIFGVRFLCHHPPFGMVLVPNTYNSRLFESNTPGMEVDTQKKIKNVSDEYNKI